MRQHVPVHRLPRRLQRRPARHSPQKEWPVNAALDKTLLVLKPIKDTFGEGAAVCSLSPFDLLQWNLCVVRPRTAPRRGAGEAVGAKTSLVPGAAVSRAGLSWADLIMLAGQVALERAGSKPMQFCGGRTDAANGEGSATLSKALFDADTYVIQLPAALHRCPMATQGRAAVPISCSAVPEHILMRPQNAVASAHRAAHREIVPRTSCRLLSAGTLRPWLRLTARFAS